MKSPPTRPTLLLKIRDSGDRGAWDEFVELYTPLVYAFCASRGVARDDLPDVTQETMRAVAGAIERFEYNPERGHFRTWLFKVTYSKLARHFERRNRQPVGSGLTAVREMIEDLPDEESERDWDLEYKHRMFEWASEKARPEFVEQTWKAFWLTAVEERPGTEVAATLGMSPGAVYVAKSRVIARLRDYIAEVTGEFEDPPA